MVKIARRDFTQRSARATAAMGIRGRFESAIPAETQMQEGLPGKMGREASILGQGGGYFTERVTGEDDRE